MSLPVVIKRARHAKSLIDRDYDRLNLVDRYARGLHRAPWMPTKANAEFKDLVKRSIVNVSSLAVEAPLNALRVQGFRKPGSGENAYEWRYWQKARLDERQNAVHRAALTSGAAYVVVTPDPRKGRREPLIRAYDAISTVAVYADPAWDEFPCSRCTCPSSSPTRTAPSATCGTTWRSTRWTWTPNPTPRCSPPSRTAWACARWCGSPRRWTFGAAAAAWSSR